VCMYVIKLFQIAAFPTVFLQLLRDFAHMIYVLMCTKVWMEQIFKILI